MKKLPEPQVVWRDDGTPESIQFEDIYFAPAEGLAESRHVFIEGIEAPDIWQDRETFTVFETGFGTGLNFLATWQAWAASPSKGGHLHYVAVEGFPLQKQDLQKALLPIKELAELSCQLIEQYPPRHPGFHQINFEKDRITLTLYFGPIEKAIASFEGTVDAWYLDGFAPSRNPEMWSTELFNVMAKGSNARARVATFTVAGAVRRGLEAGGFTIARHPGFGRKRECLRGTFVGVPGVSGMKPWYANPTPFRRGATVAVIGSGIAGAMIARRLQDQGLEVDIYERNAGAASEASGNPAGLINPGLTLSDDPIADFREQACLHAVRYYDGLEAKRPGIWKKTGVVQLASSKEIKVRQKKLIEFYGDDTLWFESMSAQQASSHIGLNTPHSGFMMRQAGLVRPADLCGVLLEGMTCTFNVDVAHLERGQECWALLDAQGRRIGEAEIVVLANAQGAAGFAQSSHFPLTQNRGQVSYLPVSKETEHMQVPASFSGYLSPPFVLDGKEVHVLGATYNELEDPPAKGWDQVRPEDHQKNLEALQKSFDLVSPLETDLDGRVSYRVRTPDRLPLIGPVPVAETYARAYETVRYGNRFESFPRADLHDGLFVMAGFGSRGFQWAPLAADILAAQILGLPSPVSRDVAEIVHPARFVMRDLRRA